MAADFIGVTVLVTLNDPPNAKIRGLVRDVVGQQLNLSDGKSLKHTWPFATIKADKGWLVTWLDNALYVESFVVEGPNILQLEIESTVQAPVRANPIDEQFVDPAIISYDRPAIQGVRLSYSSSVLQPNGLRPSAPPSVLSEPDSGILSITPSTVSLKPVVPMKTKPKVITSYESTNDNVASATLSGPFNQLTLDGGLHVSGIADYKGSDGKPDEEISLLLDRASPVSQIPLDRAGKRTRRGRKSKGVRNMQPYNPLDVDAGSRRLFETPLARSAPGGNARKRNKATGSNGWRQTPLLEDASHMHLAPSNGSNRSVRRAEVALAKLQGRRSERLVLEERKGWATEDATDIQDMGDFDFVGNLSKFDKHEIFHQIRQGDATADEERLVNINRLPHRLGTAGGKNLHYTENVLSPKVDVVADWNSEAGNSKKDARERMISSGKSSRRNVSHASLKKPSRKGSAIAAEQQRARSRLPAKAVGRNPHSPQDVSGSPILKSSFPSESPDGSLESSLHVLPSDHPCPCLSPLQMLEIEQLAISELDLSEDMISENASRGIAETARKIISANANHKGGGLAQTCRKASPLVVILAGNNKTGARAIGGGRQLRNHGTRAVVCVLGLHREEDLLDSVRRQLSIYRKSGGQVTNFDELWKTLKYINAPTELIIDALLGMHTSPDDLHKDDKAIFQELLAWANGGAIDVLTIDVPSGLDAWDGKSAQVRTIPGY